MIHIDWHLYAPLNNYLVYFYIYIIHKSTHSKTWTERPHTKFMIIVASGTGKRGRSNTE